MASPGASENHTMDDSKNNKDGTFILGLSTIQFVGVCIASLALLSTMVAIVMLLAKKCGYCHGGSPESEDGEDRFMGEDDDEFYDSDGERYGPREPTRVRFASIDEQAAHGPQRKEGAEQPLAAGPVLDNSSNSQPSNAHTVCDVRQENEVGARLIEAQLHYDSADVCQEDNPNESVIQPEKATRTSNSSL